MNRREAKAFKNGNEMLFDFCLILYTTIDGYIDFDREKEAPLNKGTNKIHLYIRDHPLQTLSLFGRMINNERTHRAIRASYRYQSSM